MKNNLFIIVLLIFSSIFCLNCKSEPLIYNYYQSTKQYQSLKKDKNELIGHIIYVSDVKKYERKSFGKDTTYDLYKLISVLVKNKVYFLFLGDSDEILFESIKESQIIRIYEAQELLKNGWELALPEKISILGTKEIEEKLHLKDDPVPIPKNTNSQIFGKITEQLGDSIYRVQDINSFEYQIEIQNSSVFYKFLDLILLEHTVISFKPTLDIKTKRRGTLHPLDIKVIGFVGHDIIQKEISEKLEDDDFCEDDYENASTKLYKKN